MVGKQSSLVPLLVAGSVLAHLAHLPRNIRAAEPPPSSAPPQQATESTGLSGAPLKTNQNGKIQGQLPTKTPVGPEFENVRNALNALTPEQLQRFQQNFLRWSNLSPEEKKLLRDRETLQRQKMLAEAQNSLTKTGLQLSEDQKTQFFKRYGEERRKIEESIRVEMETLRKPRLEALIQQLKSEFSAQQSAPSAPTAP